MHRRLKKQKIPYSTLSSKSKKAIDELVAKRDRRLEARKELPKLIVLPGFIKKAKKIWELCVKEPKEAKEATRLVGKALVDEALKNSEFRDSLNKYRYVLVNFEGDLVLTNKGRRMPFLGFIRLESIKILLGIYQ